jgi:hypothetical protein
MWTPCRSDDHPFNGIRERSEQDGHIASRVAKDLIYCGFRGEAGREFIGVQPHDEEISLLLGDRLQDARAFLGCKTNKRLNFEVRNTEFVHDTDKIFPLLLCGLTPLPV